MDKDVLLAQPETAICISVGLAFFLSKKQQICNASAETKDFSVDGNEYNAFNDFLLFI